MTGSSEAPLSYEIKSNQSNEAFLFLNLDYDYTNCYSVLLI